MIGLRATSLITDFNRNDFVVFRYERTYIWQWCQLCWACTNAQSLQKCAESLVQRFCTTVTVVRMFAYLKNAKSTERSFHSKVMMTSRGQAIASSMGFSLYQVRHSFFYFWDTIFVIFERQVFNSNGSNPTNRSLVAPSWQFFSACPSIAQIYCFYCFYIPRSRLYCAVKVSLGRKYLRSNNVIFAYLYLFRVSDSKRGTFIFEKILHVFTFFSSPFWIWLTYYYEL